MIFDNQKISGFLGPYRFLKNWAKASILPCRPSSRAGSTAILPSSTSGSRRARSCSATGRPSPTFPCVVTCIYPAEEFGFDIAKDYPAIGVWLERIKAFRAGSIPTS